MSDRRQFNEPKIFSRDEISALSDHDLDAAMRDMSHTIRRYRRDGRDPRHFEIEYCYLDNEKQRRMNLGGGKSRGNSHRNRDNKYQDRQHNKYSKKRDTVAMTDCEPVSPREITNTHI